MKIIAFYGAQGSGKSEAASSLLDNHLFEKMSFADPIYDMVSTLLHRDARAFNKHEPVLCGKSVRHLLQTLGTDWGRHMVGDNIWLDAVDRRLRSVEAMGGRKFVVIDDLRFQNEYEWLRERDALIVRIERPQLPRAPRMHESEMDWPHFEADLVLENPSTGVHEWRVFVREAVTRILQQKAAS